MINDDKVPEGDELDKGSTEIPEVRPGAEVMESPLEGRQPAIPADLPDISEIEIEAISKGWKPEQDFDVPDKEYVSAEVFLGREPIFKKMKAMEHRSNRDNRRLREQVQDLTDMMKDSRAQGYDQALRDLGDKRKEAVEIGDIDAFNSIDSEYEKVQQAIAKHEATPRVETQQEIDPAALEFQDRNKDWFNNNTQENTDMVNQAVTVDQYLSEAKPYLTEIQRLDLVEKELKELYPHRFTNSKKKQPAAVESVQRAGVAESQKAASTRLKYTDLDDDEKTMCANFMDVDDSLTVEDYLKSYQTTIDQRKQKQRRR